jgi:hypothetical protein
MSCTRVHYFGFKHLYAMLGTIRPTPSLFSCDRAKPLDGATSVTIGPNDRAKPAYVKPYTPRAMLAAVARDRMVSSKERPG